MKQTMFFVLLLLSFLTSCFSSDSADDSAAQARASANRVLTYWDDAKPIIDLYCVSCHRSGGEAPFSLTSFKSVYAYRSAIEFAIESETMPPTGFNEMSTNDSALVLAWLNMGAQEGDEEEAAKYIIKTDFTYDGEIKEIIDRKCATCHIENGFAPFALTTYDQVYALRAASYQQVDSGIMPPWPPSQGFTPFKYDRSLTQEERYKILNWIDGGAPENNTTTAALATAAKQTTTLSQPIRADMSITMSDAYTPMKLPDDYRCFVLDWNRNDSVYVTGVNVIPGVIQQAHHVIVGIIEPEFVELYTVKAAEDAYPGFECFGGMRIPGVESIPRQVAGWVPGDVSGGVPPGTGILIKPGSKLLMQMHYNTIATAPKPDQTSVILQVDASVDRPAFSFLLAWPLWLRQGGMPIPANDPDVTLSATFPAKALQGYMGSHIGTTREDSFSIHSVGLHMHTLGEWGQVSIIRNDSTVQMLLEILNWDFSWQDTYPLTSEFIVNPTDNLKLTCNWNNSDANQIIVDGQQIKSRDLEWGEGTWDEMCLTMLYVTAPPSPLPTQSQEPTLYIDKPKYRDIYAPGQTIPIKLNLNNFTLQEPSIDHSEIDYSELDESHEHPNADSDHSAVNGGHYHIYLDQDHDDAEHVTYWENQYFYTLPTTITEGLHTIRVSLLADDHHPLGIEESVEIMVKAPSSKKQGVALVSNDDWAVNAAEKDNLAPHRPAPITCPSSSFYNEEGALEVETGYCNYLSLSQPSKTNITAWDNLHLVLWHGQLRFDTPAKAHVAISILGTVVWEQTISIPANASVYDLTIPIPFDVPEGSAIEYHLHNHGFNTWSLLTLEKIAK